MTNNISYSQLIVIVVVIWKCSANKTNKYDKGDEPFVRILSHIPNSCYLNVSLCIMYLRGIMNQIEGKMTL